VPEVAKVLINPKFIFVTTVDDHESSIYRIIELSEESCHGTEVIKHLLSPFCDPIIRFPFNLDRLTSVTKNMLTESFKELQEILLEGFKRKFTLLDYYQISEQCGNILLEKQMRDAVEKARRDKMVADEEERRRQDSLRSQGSTTTTTTTKYAGLTGTMNIIMFASASSTPSVPNQTPLAPEQPAPVLQRASRECPICFDPPVEHWAAMPCLHWVCGNCKPRMIGKPCCKCRQIVQTFSLISDL
jgi:hypothetical protein